MKSSAAESSGNMSQTPTGGASRRVSNCLPGDSTPKVAKKCDPAYLDVCVTPPLPDLDCGNIPYRNFRVLPPDPHQPEDKDGIACET